MANYYLDKNGNLTKKKKKKGNNYILQEDGTMQLETYEEDIAPVKATEKEDDLLDIFQKGAFEDGYQFGDVTKTTLGTLGDAGLGIVQGTSSLLEGIKDAGQYAVAGVSDFFGADEFAEDVRNDAKRNSTKEIFGGASDYVNQYSVLGDTSDAVMQGIGQIIPIILTGGVAGGLGLGATGVTALTTGLMGVSSAGSGMSEAYEGGATDEEATVYGISKGVIDAGTELIFGGLGKTVKAVGLSKGLSSLDDVFAQKLSSKLSNQVAKNFAEFGVKASAEGFEEVLAGVGTAVAKNLTYMDDKELAEIIKDENLLEQFVVGMATSGMIQSGYIPATESGSLKEANATGRDFITGYTQNEQSVIDKEVENRITERENNGTKLTNKEKDNIREEVQQDLERGQISLDTIESVLGGETYETYKSLTEKENSLREEIKRLQSDPRPAVKERLAEAQKELSELENNSAKAELKDRLSLEVQELTKSERLSESYNEKARRSQKFEADLTKYDAKTQETVKKAVESGILNNTNRTHEFVDMIAKLSADNGVSFDFTNNENLKNSGFALEGKTVNGLVKDNDIILNIDSSKALNSVVGHEITHVLEGTELYTELQNAVKEYATTKGEYDTRYKALQDLYKDVEGANIDNELTAELVGEYLFTDSDFVNNLSATKPNVFKKIYDEIKYLYKVATAGSKEARQLEKVKRAFDKAYKETGNKKSNSSTGYALYLTENDIPNYLKAGSRENKNRQSRYEEGQQMIISSDAEFDSFVEKSIEGNPDNMVAYGKVDNQLAEKVKEKSDSQIDIADAYLELLSNDVQHAYREHYVAKEEGDLDMSVDDLKYALKNVNTAEVVSAKTYKDGAKRVTLAIPMDNGVMMLVELASKSAGSLRLKTGWKITNEKYEQKYKSSLPTTGNNSSTKTVHDNTASTDRIPQNSKNASGNVQYSLSEDSHKQKQLDIVLKSNPAENETSTWIRSKDDILTFEEALNIDDYVDYKGEDFDESYPYSIAEKALETGKITVYSSYPIGQGIFVTPSRMEALSYSGNGKVYSKKVSITDVAWIDPTQGQYAKVETDYSLSAKNQDIAPTGNYNVYGKDIALQKPEIAPQMPETVENMPISESKVQNTADEYAPIKDTSDIDAQQSDRLYSLNEGDMPEEVEAPYYETEDVKLDDPFLERDIKDVGKRNINAYMYDNPEVKPYFQEEAQNMLWELKNSVKGEKSFNDKLYYDTNGEQGWFGTKRETSDDIAYLLDNHGYTYADIEKGLNAIIEDHGAENNAISKRIEFALNDRLKDGYTDFMSGNHVPANQDYVNLLMDKQINTYSDEAYNQYLESLAQEYASQDIAPVRQQYEAIEPAPQSLDAQEQEWTNNKMARVKDPNKVTPHKVEAKQRRWVETSTESEVVNREILPDDLDLSKIVYEPIPNKVTLGKANAKLGTLGYDESLAYFNNQLAGKKASLEDIALGERLLQEAMKKGDTATAGELIQNISILGTELGQKVQALSIIQRLTPEGQLKMLYKTVKRGKVKGDKAFEGVELTQEMIDHILKTYKADGTYDQNELNKAVEDVKDKLAKSMNVSTIDKVNAWRYLAMLGNPKTHIRNLVSNVAMKGTVAVKNAVARSFEEIAPISDRTKTWRRATDEVRAFAEKTTLEMKEVISEDTKYSEEASIKSKRNMFKNNILNKLYEFNNDLMTKEDWWFSKSAYKNALSEYLTANGIETSKDIENYPKIVEKAKQYALEQSQIATFRQYSWLANKIREVESKNVATEVAVGSILPFKKTPVNIAKAGLSYSPLGFAKSLTYDLYKMKKGDIPASKVVDNLAQGVTGSALVYVGYMLAMSGLLSGGGEDDKEGKYDYQLGEQAYSLNIGGNSYSLSWLSPVAMPLFVGANAYEQLVEGEEWNGDVVMETLAQTLDPLSEMSFLSSLDSVLSSYDSGVEKFAGIGTTMLQSYATQFIPTLSSQVATVLDDKKRSTKVAGDSDFKIVDETINKLKYKIPFLRETLEPTTDIWGNEVKQSEDMIERALETFIAPYSRKENIATEIDAEIKDLYAQTGDNGIIPNIPYNYVNYDGEKYKMSASEYTDFKKTYGQTANDLLEDLFNTTTYQNATSEERVDLVNEVYDYASDTAKLEYLEKEGVDYAPSSTYGNIKGAIENDMSLDEFDLFTKDRGKYYISKAMGGYETYDTYKDALNDVEGDKDEDGNTINGSVKANVESYINELPLDYGQKILLFTSKYPKDDTYKADIVEYLNGRSDITYEEVKAILEALNYTVEADGTVRW